MTGPSHDSVFKTRRRNVARFFRRPEATLGTIVIATLLACAAFAPLLAPYDPYEQNIRSRLQPPSAEHLLGTDEFGRDVLSRLIYGSRLTLAVGAISVGIALVIGTTLGLLAGYFRGWVDTLISGLTDVLLSFPSFLLALGVIAVLGPSLQNAMIAVGVRGIPIFTRLMRGEALALSTRDYVQASQAMGASSPRVLLRHVLPNAFPSLLVLVTLQFPAAVLTAAGLSFLGLGAQPPSPEWGAQLVSARVYIRRAAWLVNYPGLAILITVLGFNLLGNAIRDVLDPRQRNP